LQNSIVTDSFKPNGLTVGIVGGGQLGKMMAMAAKRMSLQIAILDPDRLCPAAPLADELIVSSFQDDASIRKLAKISDVITYEIELANSRVLEELVSKKYSVHPDPRTLNIIQDKSKQKKFLKDNNIPVADFELVTSEDLLRKTCQKYGYPLLLKACKDSYDGRGNFLIRTEDDIGKGLSYFRGRQCMLEAFVPFTKELSVMVARNTSGQIQSFPVVENIHTKNILFTTIAPARIPANLANKALICAKKAIKTLNGAGIFGVEMFLKKDGSVLINEIAPRPHNSGHYSIEACTVSQFEQHLRAILGLPLAIPRLISPAVMVNILGPEGYSGFYSLKRISQVLKIQGLSLHVYGKQTTMPLRKLGHMTIIAKSIGQALLRAQSARKELIVEKQNGAK
jgi:5-(carboxyamino)imidazole ribonucleotide synthase